MTRPRALVALLLLVPLAAAQQQGSDPRDVKDPRDVPDPREAVDPRGLPQQPPQELQGRELYESLWATGDELRLGQAFRRDGWRILPYIDSHCEGWLALVEQGADQKEQGRRAMAELQAKGRKLAAIADQVLGDTRFTTYVHAFYGWDKAQQAAFREGQRLFAEGARLASEAETREQFDAALTPLRQSLEHSRPLSDTWGQSMALALIGRIEHETGRRPEARTSLEQARRLGREIRDLDSVFDSLGRLYEVALLLKDKPAAQAALQEQYLIAMDLGDEDLAQRVNRQLLELAPFELR